MNALRYHATIQELANQGHVHECLDAVEDALQRFPQFQVEFLALAYDVCSSVKSGGRFLYQSRLVDFALKPGDKVLDMGSGHIPFPKATVLADIALTDDAVGRAGVPFKHVDGKPVYECSVESTPFADKEFDFVYCSHVLEHVDDPEAACRELMRIGKRGYIETPTRAKDLFFATAKISHHKWAVSQENGVLIFTEYTPSDLEGLGTNLLLDMNCAPRNKREKAFAALEYVKPDQFNTMFIWEDSIEFCVRTMTKALPHREVKPVEERPLTLRAWFSAVTQLGVKAARHTA